MPPSVNTPCLLHPRVSQRTHWYPTGGSSASAAPSSSKSSSSGTPSLWCLFSALMSRESRSSLSLNASASCICGTGTNRFLLW